jgi:hypothetical protein
MGGGHRPPKREEEVERKEATFPLSGNVRSCVEGAVNRQSAPQLRVVPAGRVERDPEKGMVNGHEKRRASNQNSRRHILRVGIVWLKHCTSIALRFLP